MLHKIIEKVMGEGNISDVQAHCDVPCGIYDPISAQIAALTVVRMVDIIKGIEEKEKEPWAQFHNTVTRAIIVKEEHAEKAKHEIRIIWGDFIKDVHKEKFPEIDELVFKIMQAGSKSRQTVDRGAAIDLVESINRFAEIFWEIKGVKTKRAKAPYAPNLELVYPDL